MSIVWTRLIRGFGGAAAGLLIVGSIAVSAAAQAPPASTPAPRFAAVSIRLWHRGDVPIGPPGRGFYSDPAGLHIFFRTLDDMICFAYEINRAQLTGGPRWVTGFPGPAKGRYVINATTSAPATEEQERAMLKIVLAQRFGLKMSVESRPVKVMALTVAQGGPKLKPLKPGEPVPPFSLVRGTQVETVHAATTAGLVNHLNDMGIGPDFGGRLLFDDTGLTGQYDITVKMWRDKTLPHGGWENLPYDLKPLGLDLKPTTQTIPVHVIQDAHRPTAN